MLTDGNDMAGALREVFAVDMTVARGACVGCGLVGPVAQALVYGRAPGYVARCPGCGGVLLRLVRGPAGAWLDLRGVVCLQIPLPAGEGPPLLDPVPSNGPGSDRPTAP